MIDPARWYALEHVVPMSPHPPTIRKIVHTTNALERQHPLLCISFKTSLPNDGTAPKFRFLAIQEACLR